MLSNGLTDSISIKVILSFEESLPNEAFVLHQQLLTSIPCIHLPFQAHVFLMVISDQSNEVGNWFDFL